MEPKGSPAGVFPHKNKPSSIHISQQSQESTTGAVTTNLIAPLTPRIDISRASSSSYHEDSSPENVFDQVRLAFTIASLFVSLSYRVEAGGVGDGRHFG